MGKYHAAMATNLHGKPDALAPFLNDPQHQVRARVYRNNMLSALGQTIVDSFPAVARLVGDDFMRAMARAFVEAHPPRSPVLTFYGAEFPTFIEEFSPARSLPYLGDVARLDWAYLEAVFAKDDPCLSTADLVGRSDEDIARLKPGLHSSVCLLTSRWNAADIWHANRQDGGPSEVALREAPSAAVLWRGAAGVTHRSLSPPNLVFLRAIQSGHSLGKAMTEASSTDTMTFFTDGLAAGLFGALKPYKGSTE